MTESWICKRCDASVAPAEKTCPRCSPDNQLRYNEPRETYSVPWAGLGDIKIGTPETNYFTVSGGSPIDLPNRPNAAIVDGVPVLSGYHFGSDGQQIMPTQN